MTDPAALATLLSRYQTLCQYCDDVFAATARALQPHIRCAKGCAACCLLETVAPLEAYVIAAYLQTLEPQPVRTAARHPAQCVFLVRNACAIYPVRPVICRTHGLPLVYPDNPAVDACPRNFTDSDPTTLAPQFLFDVDRVTQNLLRLNLAFCMLTQQPAAAGERIPLEALRG